MNNVGEQVSLFGRDTWSGKTCQERSVPTAERTSVQSSKRRPKSPSRMPLFLDLRTGNGQTAEPSWGTGGALLGEYTMRSFGEYPSVAVVSRLSAILEDNPPQKYSLSAKACQGILNRAERRGKKLPEELEKVLKVPANHSALNQEVKMDAPESTSIDDKAETLNCMHDQQAVMVLNDQGGSVMDVSQGTTATLRAQSHGHEPSVLDQSFVRRLTPLECERLQGYPDGWTDIGEWVDSKGKRHKDADSPRYKALGNSIALPFWFWLLRRISAQYIGPATLGSLFDGIGGFPLCWERCNGKGTALWASEIEEFPMAVTRKHFVEENDHE